MLATETRYRTGRGVVRVLLLVTVAAVVLAAGLGSANAQSFQEELNETYGGADLDFANSVIETSDGGLAIAGGTDSFGAGDTDGWLIKTDSNGNEQFNVTYGGAGSDFFRSVAETSDGGYILAGRTSSFGSTNDAWLIKTDSNGNEEFNVTLGGADLDQANSVVETSDGGFAFGGRTDSFGAGDRAAWLVKTNESGDVQFNLTYGGPNSDDAQSMIETSDGGFALAGETDSFSDGGEFDRDAWLIKTNASGDEEFNVTYGGSGDENANSVIETSDGGFALGGETRSFGAGGNDAWLIKTNASGDEEFNETYGGGNFDDASSVIETSGGDFVLVGRESSFGGTDTDRWLIVANESGNERLNESLGGGSFDIAYSVIETSDRGLAIAGGTESFGAGDRDVWLTKGKVETPIASCADDITSSGLYGIDGDITDGTAPVCISITASDVVLDGGGNTLDGNGTGGIAVNAMAPENVVVRNLTTTGWNNGVRYEGVNNGTLASSDVTNSSESGVVVENSDGTVVEGNAIVGNNLNEAAEAAGVYVNGSDGVEVTDNEVRKNAKIAAVVNESNGAAVTNNEITGTTSDGTNVRGGLALGGTSDDVLVESNNVSDNAGIGVFAGPSVTLFDGANLTVRDLRANSNELAGLVVQGPEPHTLRGIVANDNQNGVGTGSPNSVVDNVTAVGNDNTGLAVGPTGAGTVIENSDVRENGFGAPLLTTGINVNPGATDVTIRDTTATDNDIDLRAQATNTTLETVDVGSATVSGTATEVRLNETVSPPADPSGVRNVGSYLNATNTTASGFFDATVKYTDGAASDVDESSLALWRYNGTWNELPSTVDTAANAVSANITDFSVFAPLGNPTDTGCVERRSVGRGQSDEECPSDRTLSRGEDRQGLGRGDGGRGRDRGRRSRGR